MQTAELGVIGGSGLYAMTGFEAIQEVTLDTPFGAPSAPIVVGELAGRRVAFLARHGRGHRLLPSEINYCANIFALKLLGVERILSASAVGSLKEHIAPLDVVLPDQFIDATRRRRSTFFGEGLAAHVAFSHPTCAELGALLNGVLERSERRVHRGGAYACIEGPQFSTLAESELYRRSGAAVIGMTNATEAKLAREAEMCYVTMALVTDYDCWHEEESVSVEAIVRRLQQNAETAREAVLAAVSDMPSSRACACGRALESAIITAPEGIDAETRKRLAPLVGRYLGSA